jgi:hypothetical protein
MVMFWTTFTFTPSNGTSTCLRVCSHIPIIFDFPAALHTPIDRVNIRVVTRIHPLELDVGLIVDYRRVCSFRRQYLLWRSSWWLMVDFADGERVGR